MKIGIDFGTSFSLPAYCDPNSGQKITLLPAGKYGIPSVFYYDSWSGVVIGEEAEHNGQGDNARFLKREIKMDLTSTFEADGKNFTACDIVEHILKAVRDTALEEAGKRLLGTSVDEVTLSVPAEFTHNEKELLRQAAEKAGLKIHGFIKEPVAAALAYFEESLADQTRILVYDLGGGTCDIAIVEADRSCKEKYRVIDAAMLRVGGKDWDEKIRAYLEHELRKSVGGEVDKPGVAEKLKREAITVKHAFSEPFGNGFRERVRAIIEVNGSNHQIGMTREMFNEMTIGLFRRTMEKMRELINKHSATPITKIICVGGGSNMPQVQEGLRNAFPNMQISVYEPEKAIAVGAAIYAHMENGEGVADIAPFSYGTDCAKDYKRDPNDQIVVNLIKKGDALPAVGERSFITVKDNAARMTFDIYESDCADPSYPFQRASMTPIIKVALMLPPGTPKGTAVYCKVTLTRDGLITIYADDRKGHTLTTTQQLNF